MKLEFIEGQFFLSGCAGNLRRDYWSKVGPQTYATKDLGAAVEFKSFSTEKTARIITRALNVSYDVEPLSPHQLPFLDAHQVEGVNWILSRKRCYLAHAPGAGKTAQAITAAFISGRATSKTLFIVPPSLTTNWVREVEKFGAELGWWPTVAVVPVSAARASMNWDAHVIICPDSMLWAGWVYGKLRDLKDQFKFIAVDEASRLKEATSKRSIAFYGGFHDGVQYSGLFQKARHVCFLDGSPMPNRAVELWAPTFALDPAAIDFMCYDDFGFRYGNPTRNERGQWEYKGTSQEAELKAKIQKRFMHVVPESRLNHPERLRSILWMNEDVRTHEQKTWEAKHLSKVELSDESFSQGDLARFRRELGLRKIPFIASYVSERLKDKAEFILLFVWHREVALELSRKLNKFKPGLVMGGTSNEDREKAFSDFQEGRSRLIIGNIQAMGRGHNLQRGDRAIFGEFSWTDQTNVQCEKRSSRRGRDSEKAVRCEYICCPNSIDEKVLSSVFVKEKRVRKVIG